MNDELLLKTINNLMRSGESIIILDDITNNKYLFSKTEDNETDIITYEEILSTDTNHEYFNYEINKVFVKDLHDLSTPFIIELFVKLANIAIPCCSVGIVDFRDNLNLTEKDRCIVYFIKSDNTKFDMIKGGFKDEEELNFYKRKYNIEIDEIKHLSDIKPDMRNSLTSIKGGKE